MLEAYQKFTNRLVNRVNDQRGMNNRLRDAIVPRQVRKQFLEAVRLAHKTGLAIGLQAEASQRLKGNKFLITTEQSWFGQLTEDDLGVAALNENFQMMAECLPQYIDWHYLVYQTTEAQAVLLSQPAAATAVSMQTPTPTLPEEIMRAVVGAAFCSPETATLKKALHNHNVLLINGVGLLALGDSLPRAIARSETVNRWCEILLINKHK